MTLLSRIVRVVLGMGIAFSVSGDLWDGLIYHCDFGDTTPETCDWSGDYSVVAGHTTDAVQPDTFLYRADDLSISSLSVAGWFYITSTDIQVFASQYGSGGDATESWMLWYAGYVRGTVQLSDGEFTIGGPSLDVGWHFIAMVFDHDTNNLYIYVDSASDIADTSTGTLNDINEEIRIGAGIGADYFCGCYIDDFALWNRALSEAEIDDFRDISAATPTPTSTSTPAATPTPTSTSTPAATPTPTPTPLYSYDLTLNSGNRLRIVREITVGEIVLSSILFLLLALGGIYILYRVIMRWVFP